jgi:NarL family two-component system response regulator LiaR
MQDLRVIKILVVDHHAVVGRGLATILDACSDFEVVGQAESGEEALRLMEKCVPDIVAMDIDLAGRLSGLDVVHTLRRNYPGTKIVILTNILDEMTVQNALQAGVASYLLKTASLDDLARALRDAHRGIPTLSPDVTQLVIRELSSPIRNGRKLTSREYQVLALIARGSNNHEIARTLNISLSTVQFHVRNILQKLQVRNRVEAAAFAVRNKLIGNVDR